MTECKCNLGDPWTEEKEKRWDYYCLIHDTWHFWKHRPTGIKRKATEATE